MVLDRSTALRRPYIPCQRILTILTPWPHTNRLLLVASSSPSQIPTKRNVEIAETSRGEAQARLRGRAHRMEQPRHRASPALAADVGFLVVRRLLAPHRVQHQWLDDRVESARDRAERLAGDDFRHRRADRRWHCRCRERLRRRGMACRLPGVQSIRVGDVWELLPAADADFALHCVVWGAARIVSTEDETAPLTDPRSFIVEA